MLAAVKFPSLSNCSGIMWTLAQNLLPSQFSSFVQNVPATCERSGNRGLILNTRYDPTRTEICTDLDRIPIVYLYRN